MQQKQKTDEQIKKEMIDLLMEKITGGLSERVIDYGNAPRNCGILDRPDGYAKIKGPCGDTMEIWLRVADGVIERASFWTDGCGTTIAAGSMVGSIKQDAEGMAAAIALLAKNATSGAALMDGTDSYNVDDASAKIRIPYAVYTG